MYDGSNPSFLGGMDVVNQKVVDLVRQNQTENETDLIKSLNTNTITDTQKFTATDDKIMGDVQKQSSKKKTFGVFDSKQVVESKAGSVASSGANKVNDVAADASTNLANKTGGDVSNDQGYDAAVSKANESVKGTIGDIRSKKSSTGFGISTGYFFDDFGALGGSPSSSSSSTGSSTTTTASDANSNETPSLNNPQGLKIKETVNRTADADVRAMVDEDVPVENFDRAKVLVNGPLAEDNSCPDLSNALGFDKLLDTISSGVDNLRELLGLGINPAWIECFASIYADLGLDDKLTLISDVTGNGDIASANKLMGQVSKGNLSSPVRDVFDIGDNYMPKLDSKTGKIIDTVTDSNVSTSMDELLAKTDVGRLDLFSVKGRSTTSNKSISDTLDITDVSVLAKSNSVNNLGKYALGNKYGLLATAPV